jgi:hypothetical protein
MLTLFTVPKPFKGHIEVIQRNAIKSWLQLRPACEVILVGNEEGTAEVARGYGVRHLPDVARNEYGTPLLNDIFEKAQHSATHDLLCYVNADIILMGDFIKALQRVDSLRSRFLVVGQRWDLDVRDPLDFDANWEARLRARTVAEGTPHLMTGIDYFAFPCGFWNEIPPFAIGRTAWDNWLIYRARAIGSRVIDATNAVLVIHQNHDYSHSPQGADGVWKGPEARYNLVLAGGKSHLFSLLDATWVLTDRGRMRPALTVEHLRRRWETLPLVPAPGLERPFACASVQLGMWLHDWLPGSRLVRVARRTVREAQRLLSVAGRGQK